MELNVTDSKLSMQFSVILTFLQIRFTFSYLGLKPMACQFIVNNLHSIMYFTHKGQSPDRQQPIKEPF